MRRGACLLSMKGAGVASATRRPLWRPEFSSYSSSNRRGHVARWEVIGKRLFLVPGNRELVAPGSCGMTIPARR